MKRSHDPSVRRRRRLVLEQLERREMLTAAGSSPIVEVQLGFTDLAGGDLVQPVVGEPFLLNAYVRDARVDPAGVYAAYMDVTFDPEILAVTGIVDVDSLFSVARDGRLCVQDGLVDDVGAASGSLHPIGNDWFRLFSIELTPLSDRPTTIATNPADELVTHDVLVYGLDNAIPHELVVYGDIQLAATPAESEVTIVNPSGQACTHESEPSDDGVVEPAPSIVGADLTGQPVSLAESALNGIVEVQLGFTDLAGGDLVQPVVGEPFLLNAYVRDSRVDPAGVFAAYMDVTFDPDILAVTGIVNFDSLFSVARAGRLCVQEGLIDDVGAASGSLQPTGDDWFRLFSIELTALSDRPTTIATNPADERVTHDILVYGLDDPIPLELVVYGEVHLEATPAESEVPVVNSPGQACTQESEPSDNGVEALSPLYVGADLTAQPVSLVTFASNEPEDRTFHGRVASLVLADEDLPLTWEFRLVSVSRLESHWIDESRDDWNMPISHPFERAYFSIEYDQGDSSGFDMFDAALRNRPGDIVLANEVPVVVTLLAAPVAIVEPQIVPTSDSSQWMPPRGEELSQAAPANNATSTSQADWASDEDTFWTELWGSAIRPSSERIPALLVDEVLTQLAAPATLPV